MHYENDEAAKAKKHEDFAKNVYPAMLDKLDEIIKQNNGHLALGKVRTSGQGHFFVTCTFFSFFLFSWFGILFTV